MSLFTADDLQKAERPSRIHADARVARHVLKHAVLTRNIRAVMSDLPQPDEAVHLIAHGSFNAFTFVPYLIEEAGRIEELCIAVYRISSIVISSLVGLIDSGDIGRCIFVINDNVQRLKPETFAQLKAETDKHDNVAFGMVDNHAKVTCAQTKSAFFVIQGSGNWSTNARIEQYCIVNSRDAYEFHRAWMQRSVESRWT